MIIFNSVGSLWNAEKFESDGCRVPELDLWLKDKLEGMIYISVWLLSNCFFAEMTPRNCKSVTTTCFYADQQ